MSFIGLNASAQDVIVQRNGDELQCKILEVSKNEVKYKRWSNQEGPTFTEKKADIFMLKYENGEKEVVAYESSALTTPVVTPNLTTTTPTEITLSDPTPISNVYLEYTSRGKRESGIIKWGHMQFGEQAQNILTNDWLDYRKARKEERTGKVLAITGGSLFLGGLGWTIAHIVYSKRYSDAKKEYDEMDYNARLQYDAEVKGLYDNMKSSENSLNIAKLEYEKAEMEYETLRSVRNQVYKDYRDGLISDEDWGDWDRNYGETIDIFHQKEKVYYNIKQELEENTRTYEQYINWCPNYQRSEYYSDSYSWELNRYEEDKRASAYAMISGLTTGSVLFVVGMIKAKRGHKNATQIVSKYNDEYEKDSKKSSMSKPEFNVNSKGNNLAFTLTF